MEKKTNKAKLEFFKFLRKSAESQGYSPLIRFAEIVPSMEIQYIYTLARVFLHAELISAMKTVQNPTVFMKT